MSSSSTAGVDTSSGDRRTIDGSPDATGGLLGAGNAQAQDFQAHKLLPETSEAALDGVEDPQAPQVTDEASRAAGGTVTVAEVADLVDVPDTATWCNRRANRLSYAFVYHW